MATLRIEDLRVLVTQRGGQSRLGELTEVTDIEVTRELDGVGTALVQVVAPRESCCQLLSQMRTIGHELVVLQSGNRIWEGPITSLKLTPDSVEIGARDVSWYLSRRVNMKTVTPVAAGVLDVVGQLIHDGFGSAADWSDDAYGYRLGRNVLLLRSGSDAQTSRDIPGQSGSITDVLNQFRDRGVLHWAVMGRRIMFWDSDTIMGTLPPMTDEDFSDHLWVEEEGSDTATRTIVTNNADTGQPGDLAEAPAAIRDFYGNCDQIFSDVREGNRTVRAIQNQKRLAGLWPPPINLGIPDDAGLLECSPVFVNSLVPGCIVHVKSDRTCRKVSAYKQLTGVKVKIGIGSARVGVSFGVCPADMVPETSRDHISDGMVP